MTRNAIAPPCGVSQRPDVLGERRRPSGDRSGSAPSAAAAAPDRHHPRRGGRDPAMCYRLRYRRGLEPLEPAGHWEVSRGNPSTGGQPGSGARTRREEAGTPRRSPCRSGGRAGRAVPRCPAAHPSHSPSASNNRVTAVPGSDNTQQWSARASSTIRSPSRRITRRPEPPCTSQTALISTRKSATAALRAPATPRLSQARRQHPQTAERLIVPPRPARHQLVRTHPMPETSPRIHELDTHPARHRSVSSGDRRRPSALARTPTRR
jgi:hypothetical protein